MFQTRIIDSLDQLYSIKENWNNLYLQCKITYPFLTFEWVTIWWKHFAKTNKLFIMLVTENNEIIAIAPFMHTKRSIRGIPLKTISFMTNYHSNRAEIMILKKEDQVINHIFNYLINVTNSINLIELNFIPEESHGLPVIDKALTDNKLKHLKFIDFNSPYITINNQWDDYFQERPRRIRQKNRSLRRKHKTDFSILRYKEYNEECLQKIFQISNNTWKKIENSAIISQKETLNFYTSLAKTASDKGWLDILILEYQEIPIAFDFKLIYQGTNYCLKIGFDMNYGKHSPGQFLMAQSIQNSFEDNLKEFDFVGDQSRFKREWTDLLRKHYKYLIFSKNLLGSCASFLELDIIRKYELNKLYHKLKSGVKK